MDRLREIWRDMNRRCKNPNRKDYKWYGARGITVCDEWNQYPEFKKWAESHGYADTLTIDRINPDKGYSPTNCKWATIKEQCNNRRSNHFIEYDGRRLTISKWAEYLNINVNTLKSRIRRGWDIQRAMEVNV